MVCAYRSLGARWALRIVATIALLGMPVVRQLPAQVDARKTTRDSLGMILQPKFFNVPASPAFDLLPGAPEDVVHVMRPKDLQSTVSTWFDGKKLRAGMAFDTRPLGDYAGDLTKYQGSWLRRLAFRTIAAAGTAVASSGTDDVIFAAGMRTTLWDRGDARMDTAYVASGLKYAEALAGLGIPQPDMPEAEMRARSTTARVGSKALRDARDSATWNAARLDLGFGGSARVLSGAADRDSLREDRFSGALALSLPLGRTGGRGQVTLGARALVGAADKDSAETRRTVLGARLRYFASSTFSLSVENAWLATKHKKLSTLDDQWQHRAVLLEWLAPQLGGWIGVGYGVSDSEADGKKRFQVRYSIYSDPLNTRK